MIVKSTIRETYNDTSILVCSHPIEDIEDKSIHDFYFVSEMSDASFFADFNKLLNTIADIRDRYGDVFIQVRDEK